VDKQVELADKTDTVLYVLLDSIRDSIRQFLTFEQRLKDGKAEHRNLEFYRSGRNRELYFAALEVLRAHIHRTLLEVAKIANMKKLPGLEGHMSYAGDWELAAYKELKGLP
jgi:hypothetical protein